MSIEPKIPCKKNRAIKISKFSSKYQNSRSKKHKSYSSPINYLFHHYYHLSIRLPFQWSHSYLVSHKSKHLSPFVLFLCEWQREPKKFLKASLLNSWRWNGQEMSNWLWLYSNSNRLLFNFSSNFLLISSLGFFLCWHKTNLINEA